MPSVNLSHVNYRRIVSYAKATGQTISEAATKAINDWMDITGESILEGLEKLPKQGRILAWPDKPARMSRRNL